MRIGGLASGMDINQLVKDLMNAERMPLNKLTQQRIWKEWQRDAYREVNLSLTNLRTTAENMRFQSTFNTNKATSSNSNVTVSANSNALQGNYIVEVLSTAATAKIHSANRIEHDGRGAVATDRINAEGTITVTNNKGEETQIAISETMTFREVASKIQATTAGTSTELRASFDNTTSRFFLSSRNMGEDQNFTLSFSNSELADKIINNGDETSSTSQPTDYTTTGTNGAVTFDGILINGLTTNTTTVNGITINLMQTGTTNITIQSDPTASFEKIKGFVDKYNETIAEMELQLIQRRYPDFQPLTEEQRAAMSEREIELWEEKAKSGLLRNDPILRNTLNNLRRAFMDPVQGIAPGNINMLTQIGISTGNFREGGHLNIDEDKLRESLRNNPEEVMVLFTKKEGGLGISDRVYNELNNAVRSISSRAGNPAHSTDNSVLSRRINQMNEQIRQQETRLIDVENRYWRQFSAMERAMNQMNQQSMWMQLNMFGGM